MERTIVLSVGSYGGFYFDSSDVSWRLCLGWIAFVWLSAEEGLVWEGIEREERRRLLVEIREAE